METVDAVATATRGEGFAAVKATALGRPALLLKLSGNVNYFHFSSIVSSSPQFGLKKVYREGRKILKSPVNSLSREELMTADPAITHIYLNAKNWQLKHSLSKLFNLHIKRLKDFDCRQGKEEMIDFGVKTDSEAIRDWFKSVDFDSDGYVDFHGWDKLLDDNTKLGSMFQV
ncbi:unnamed protein product [Strongylus vulgaris]|uniref:EF-hand domain-containing protein n=1 Tax=Strongylus vulgaris TaxID=40348 RepID=A0A3P7KHS0_STRVU|nr:unnamed protein product [Strongylus vulgaris]